MIEEKDGLKIYSKDEEKERTGLKNTGKKLLIKFRDAKIDGKSKTKVLAEITLKIIQNAAKIMLWVLHFVFKSLEMGFSEEGKILNDLEKKNKEKLAEIKKKNKEELEKAGLI